MKLVRDVVIPADHPSLAGHFPGHPVVPGVVILDEIATALSMWKPELRITGMTQVKFLSPLLPAQLMRITLAPAQEGRVAFECHTDGTLLATGQLRVASRGEHP